MIAAPHSPLVETARLAICKALDVSPVTLSYVYLAQAALKACHAEEMVRELKLAKTRLEIMLGRARACHEETDRHGVTMVEASAWIEGMEELLTRLDAGL